MNYEKAYKAALKKATQWLEDGCTDEEWTCLECVFPELRESEDERIRKAIIHYILYETKGTVSEATEHTWVKWLEKQKEPMPAWSEEDENALKYLHELISFGFTEKFFDAQTAADMREWLNTRLKSLRPVSKDSLQTHWKPSEEQMDSLRDTIVQTKGYSYSMYLPELYEQLKKLM